MTRGELCDWLVKVAREYRADSGALMRDAHMHAYRGDDPDPALLDAILVGFVNRLAMRQGIDLALYAADFAKEQA